MQNVQIPELPIGKQYRVILLLPGFSLKLNAKEILSGKSNIPIIDLGNKCICCNIQTDRTENINPFADERKLKEIFSAPVCEECKTHALADAGSLSLGVYPILIGFITALVFIIAAIRANNYSDLLLNSFIGGGILLMAFGIYLYRRVNAKKNKKIHAHCPGTNFDSMLDKELRIETGNKRLTEEILEKNPALVAVINTTKEKYPFQTLKEISAKNQTYI